MEPRKSFPEQLKEAYARPYTLPDVWKIKKLTALQGSEIYIIFYHKGGS